MKPEETEWSDRESNSDLLNAIQPSPLLIARNHRHLTNQRGKRIAPGAAQRLLHRLYVRAAVRSAKAVAR